MFMDTGSLVCIVLNVDTLVQPKFGKRKKKKKTTHERRTAPPINR